MTAHPSGYPTTRGRPPLLNDPIGVDDNGQPITIADHVVTQLRRGCTGPEVAASIHINRDTWLRWRRDGARVLKRLNNGATADEFTETEIDYADFSARCIAAEASSLMMLEELAADHAQGRVESRTITRHIGACLACGGTTRTPDVNAPHADIACSVCIKDPDGRPTGRAILRETVATLHHPPSESMVKWLLSKRKHGTYGERLNVELTGADGGPIEITASPAERLRATLIEMNERHNAIDVTLAALDAADDNGHNGNGNGNGAA